MLFVRMVCQCHSYVIPESVRRRDLGYKGYEFLTIAIFAALLLIFCSQDITSFSLCLSSAVDLFPACLRFSNMNNSAVDSLPANNPAVDSVPARVCLRFSNMNNSYLLCPSYHSVESIQIDSTGRNRGVENLRTRPKAHSSARLESTPVSLPAMTTMMRLPPSLAWRR